MAKDMDWDIRVVDHHRRQGTLDKGEHQKALDAVEDCSELAVETEAKFKNPFEMRVYAASNDGSADAE